LNNDILFGSLVVFAAYFLKGFSGFGPALVMIPLFTLIYEPGTAINVTTLFDFMAGLYLIFSVRKEMNWRFVFSVFAALGTGAFFGARLLGTLPVDLLKKLIGGTILVFSIIILVQRNGQLLRNTSFTRKLKYPVSLLGGFLGGLLSISGPPIVIYMKMMYKKDFFRTQLIGIFLFGAGWRLFLYQMNGIPVNLPWLHFAVFVVVMYFAAWVGSKVHVQVNETVFNRIVAGLLIVPALNLLLG
jgi:uncharacterized membrane protein YfcA